MRCALRLVSPMKEYWKCEIIVNQVSAYRSSIKLNDFTVRLIRKEQLCDSSYDKREDQTASCERNQRKAYDWSCDAMLAAFQLSFSFRSLFLFFCQFLS